MPFVFNIPRANGRLEIAVHEGALLFIVGANGSGKSGLMQRLYFDYHQRGARWVKAHRQSWLHTNAVTVSADQKRSYDNNIRGNDANVQARWMDPYASERTSMALYDLIDAENVRARGIAGAVDARDINLAQELAKADAPIKTINELLRQSNIPIAIEVQGNEQIVARKSGGEPFSMPRCLTVNATRFCWLPIF